MPENWEVLNTKLDFIIQKQNHLEEKQTQIEKKVAEMQGQWNQSKGVLSFLKFCSGMAVAIGSVWAFFHTLGR